MTTFGDDKHTHKLKSKQTKLTMIDSLDLVVPNHDVLPDLGPDSDPDHEVEDDPLIKIEFMLDNRPMMPIYLGRTMRLFRPKIEVVVL